MRGQRWVSQVPKAVDLVAVHGVCERAFGPLACAEVVAAVAVELRAGVESLAAEVACLVATGPVGDRDRAVAVVALGEARRRLEAGPAGSGLTGQITGVRRLAWSCRALAWATRAVRERASARWWVEVSGTVLGRWHTGCVPAWSPAQAAQRVRAELGDELALQGYADVQRRARLALVEVWPAPEFVTARPPGPPVLQVHGHRERAEVGR